MLAHGESRGNSAPDLSVRLFPYMGGILRERKAFPSIVNGPDDHVHLLTAIPPAESVAELMRVLKANSSRWVHEQFPSHKGFAWQSGYAAFSVSASRETQVRGYIEKQREHHSRVSFQEELLSFLKKHGIEFDARELWG